MRNMVRCISSIHSHIYMCNGVVHVHTAGAFPMVVAVIHWRCIPVSMCNIWCFSTQVCMVMHAHIHVAMVLAYVHTVGGRGVS